MLLEDFTLGELELLLALLQQESLRSVARKRQVSAGKLSKLLKRAEDRLGANLFERVNNRLEITADAVHFERQLDRALYSLGAVSLDESRKLDTLTIAMDPLLLFGLEDFESSSLPEEGRVRMLALTSEFAAEFALRETFDMGFFFSPVASPSQWHIRSIRRVKFAFVRTCPGHTAAPINAYLILSTRQGVKRRELIPRAHSRFEGPVFETQNIDCLARMGRTRPLRVCLPDFLLDESYIGAFEVLDESLSFETELLAMCHDQQVSMRQFQQGCRLIRRVAK